MELRMKNLNMMGVHLKIQFLWGEGEGGLMEKTICRGELPKKGD